MSEQLRAGSLAAPKMSDAGIAPHITSTLFCSHGRSLGSTWMQRVADITREGVEYKSPFAVTSQQAESPV